MPTTGMELVNKWITKNRELGLSKDDLLETTFVYGNTVYSLKQNEHQKLDIESKDGKVIIFRDLKELTDDFVCRICGSEYTNKMDTIRCCMNHDE